MYSARSKTIITIKYIRSIKKIELVNVYREDFQSILPKQRPFPFFAKCNSTKVMGRGPNTNTRNLGIFFQETVKQKIRSLRQKGTSSRCVLFIHKLSAAEV